MVETFFQGLESGEISLAIGTHSLISENVKFANLGLAVVDEQHRFGVAQRGRLNSKVKIVFYDSPPQFLGFCMLSNHAIYSEQIFRRRILMLNLCPVFTVSDFMSYYPLLCWHLISLNVSGSRQWGDAQW